MPDAPRRTARCALMLLSIGAAPGTVPNYRSAGGVPTIAAPLASVWIDAFARSHGGLQLALARSGPPQGRLNPGLQAFLDGHADFAFVTRELSEEDLATFGRAHRGAPVVVPVAGGAWRRFGFVDPVVFVVNVANPLRSLTFRQIDALLSDRPSGGSRSVRTWGDLGVSLWRARAVHIAGARAWAGEESARALTVRRTVLAIGGANARFRAVSPSGAEADVVADVALDEDAIGFTGLGHVSDPHVRVLPIAAPRRAPVAPTLPAVSSGRYPLARTVDLLLARDADGRLDPALRRFAAYVIGPGQAALRGRTDFLPLTHAQRAAARRTLSCSSTDPASSPAHQPD